MRKPRLVGFAVGVVLLGLARVAGAVGGDPYVFRALIDVDSNNGTGCQVAAKDDNFAGPVNGIERIVTARVFRFPTTANVVEVILQSCVGGTFGVPIQVDGADWPVGLNVGVDGADVVEFYVSRLALGNPESMTVSFHASISPANDVLLTTNGENSGAPIVFSFATQAAPALSRLGLVLCAGILLFGACWSLGRNRKASAAVVAVIAMAATAMTAWAVTIVLDGNVADWHSVPAAGTDVLNDSTANDPGEDIVAAFITADAQNVYFRMDQVNLAPCGGFSQPCCVNPGGAFCQVGICQGAGNPGGGTCPDPV